MLCLFVSGELQGCGGMLNGTTGRFGSVDDDGDNKYEANLECVWQIVVPDNKVIKLHFESFNVETGLNCPYDYVEVRLLSKAHLMFREYTSLFFNMMTGS